MSEEKPKETVDLRARYAWKQVEAPKTWRPKMPGEELVGYFMGKTMRNGRFGQYEVVLVLVPHRGVFMISGTRIVQLADTAAVATGWPIVVVWRGSLPLPVNDDGEVRSMKLYDLFVAEGDPLSAEEMPRVVSQ